MNITMSARRIHMILTKPKKHEMESKLERLKSLLLIISQIKTNKEQPHFVKNTISRFINQYIKIIWQKHFCITRISHHTKPK